MATYGTEAAEPFDIRTIIEDAFEQAGLGPTRVGHDWATARRSMTLLNIEVANMGYNSWVIEPQTINIVAGTGNYDLPSNTLDLLDVTILKDGMDRPISRKPLSTWIAIADKTLSGDVCSMAVVERKVDKVKMHLWPVPNFTTTATAWCRRMMYESKTSQYPDLPMRALSAYTTALAAKIAAKSKDPTAFARTPYLEDKAERLWNRVFSEDRDKSGAFFRPEMRRV
jgi:hypothetical protein